ncbi:hypothetical protein D0869_09562 [Hortaea werneckii]|uniref:Amino acid transporter transmembrane domain-containing protein n=1 Tax=Hortaea werneckii TaxID=91943 RepID=A0A3M6WH62_HORWE|nr:N amino acid transport system protein [Hortaea werneckii]KAI7591761.1 N amino acid transport system protein [Hortaea werneckii]RMX77845.1 hypothetical protein D0869_09562 [Hortaea werneckii]
MSSPVPRREADRCSENCCVTTTTPHAINQVKNVDPESHILAQQASIEASLTAAEIKFQKLGWKRLTICLIVEAVALGSLSMPAAYATLGMVPGIILTVIMGLIAIFTAYIIGAVKLKYPSISHYHEAVGLIWGKFGKELSGGMLIGLLLMLVGSHVLTGTIAFVNIVDNSGICALVWGVISAFLLFVLALPPTFTEFAILGYIDFASIICAIGITIIATGVETNGGHGVDWQLWPKEGTTFAEAFLALTNIIFAYAFAMNQFSFMDEMHTPKDYVKSVWAIGAIEIVLYTLTGALGYAFVGSKVASPALLSTSKLVSRVAFGIALPVIFISGSINSVVFGRYVLDRTFQHNDDIRLIASARGWCTWVTILSIFTVIAWAIAEAIPFFSALLGIIASLFISGFTMYFPALFWFYLLKKGAWNGNWRNVFWTIANVFVILVGLLTLVGGTYASIVNIIDSFDMGAVGRPYTCSSAQYSS